MAYKNNLEKRGKIFDGKKNQTIYLKLKLSATKNVKAGLMTSKGKIIYAESKESISKTICIDKTDRYCVFVQNKSGKTITVSGKYTV